MADIHCQTGVQVDDRELTTNTVMVILSSKVKTCKSETILHLCTFILALPLDPDVKKIMNAA